MGHGSLEFLLLLPGSFLILLDKQTDSLYGGLTGQGLFNGNRTQSETAKVLHTTQVQISRRERKILRKMRERLLE